jgi:hypothetical protein
VERPGGGLQIVIEQEGRVVHHCPKCHLQNPDHLMWDCPQWKGCHLCGFFGHWKHKCIAPHKRCMAWYCAVDPWHQHYRGIYPISRIIKRNGAKYDAQDMDAGEALFKDYNWEA